MGDEAARARNGWHVVAWVLVALTLADLLFGRYTTVGHMVGLGGRPVEYLKDCGNGWLVLTMSKAGCTEYKGEVWVRVLVGVVLACSAWS